MKIAIAAGSAAALGAIAATVWVGASVREDTVVAHPYEDGLRQDAERHARAALGLSVWLPGAHESGAAPLVFELRRRDGTALDDAEVTVQASRAETGRGELTRPARALGGGRWSADLAFPAPGAWDVRFDVVREGRRVRMERRVHVSAACDLGAGPCTRALEGGGEVTIDVRPRPLRTMRELTVRVSVRPAAPTPTPTVAVSFAMPGMSMGENRVVLAARGSGAYEGAAILVRCATGRGDWVADVELAAPGAPARSVRFPLTVPEGAR